MQTPADAPATAPPGYRVVHLGEVASTNAEALRLAAQGEAAGLWVAATAQASGRGRGGRAWSSPPGNLYASLLLRPSCPVAIAQQLALLVPVAVFDAVAALAPGSHLPGLRLKWPNDVLLEGAKLAGILVESAASAGQGLAVVIGVGLNLAAHPQAIDQPATSLAAQGIAATPAQAASALAAAMARWLGQWDEGAGFATVRDGWMARAGALGERLSVRQGTGQGGGDARIEGRYAGLDATGALLIERNDGLLARIAHGDVALHSGRR